MKHATSRLLFAYWDALRRERAAPDRADVQPGAIRHILADTFMLGVEPGLPARFRLAGSRCCALFGRELRDRPLASLWPQAREGEVREYVAAVLGESAGFVIGLRGWSDLGDETSLEMVLLPLRHRGHAQARILGAISASTLPPWTALSPVIQLETRSVRVVSAPGGARAPVPLPVVDHLERRRRFVVHEGGRTGRRSDANSIPLACV